MASTSIVGIESPMALAVSSVPEVDFGSDYGPRECSYNLKSIRLENFKSYSGVFDIGPFPIEQNGQSLVCIVGPNGSGKSNLMDAVAFCFNCADSSKLRGEGVLSNLVSSVAGGGDSASVVVTLCSSGDPSKQLLFSRTITGKSESRYRFNGRGVSLDKYREEMRECGLDTRGNFLVFQGDVESLALASPEELGDAIDRVSGSSVYKKEFEELKEKKRVMETGMTGWITARKKLLADKKRISTELVDLEKLKSLKTTLSETKTKYFLARLFELKSKMDELVDANASSESLSGLSSQLSAIEQSISSSKSKRAKIDLKLSINDRKLIKFRSERNEISNTIDGMRSKLNSLLHQVEKQKITRELNTTTHQKLVESLSVLSQKITEQEKALEIEQTKLQSLMSSSIVEDRNLKTDEGVLFPEWQTGGFKGSFGEFRRELNSFRGTILPHALVEPRTVLEEVELAIREKRTKLDLLATRHAEIYSQLTQHLAAEKSAKHEMDIADANMKNLIKSTNELVENEKLLNSKIAKSEKKIFDLSAQKQSLISDLQSVKESEKSIEREQALGETVSMLQSKISSRKIFGRVIDLITPVEPRFATAVQTAVGKYLDAVLVDSVDTAKECMRLLKSSGNAKFSNSISFIPAGDVKVAPLVEAGDFPTGIDCVSIQASDRDSEPLVRRGIAFILNDVLICDTLKEARQLAYSRHVRVVTLGGETVSGKSGNITLVGSAKPGRFSAKKVADISKQIDDLEMKIEVHSKERCGLDGELGLVRTELRSAEIGLAQATSAFTQWKSEYLRLGSAMTAVGNYLKENESSQDSVKADLERLESEKISVVERIFEIFKLEVQKWIQGNGWSLDVGDGEVVRLVAGSENDPLRDDKKQLEEARKIQRAKVQETENKLHALVNERRFVTEQVDEKEKVLRDESGAEERSKRSMETAQKNLLLKESDLKKIEAEIASIDTEMVELGGVREGLDVSIQNAIESSSALRSNVSSLRKSLQQLESKKQSIRSQQMQILQESIVENVHVPLGMGGGPEQSRQAIEALVMSAVAIVPVGGESEDIDLNELTRELLDRVDYSVLGREKRVGMFLEKCEEITGEIEKINFVPTSDVPVEIRLNSVETELKQLSERIDAMKTELSYVCDSFRSIKIERNKRFVSCFRFVSQKVNALYRQIAGSYCSASVDLEIPVPSSEEALANVEVFVSGVIYSLMPPHKRYTNIELLSGGEKTVAAVALLFALLSYSSPPFAIVDEIDAALDAGNVGGLAKFMRMAGPKQLIAISLNPKMYTKADCLLGVYKDGPDKSGLVSVDLRPFEDDMEEVEEERVVDKAMIGFEGPQMTPARPLAAGG